MKYLIAVCIITYYMVFAKDGKDQASEIVMNYKNECMNETQVDVVLVKNALRHGKFLEDEKLKEFFLCFFRKFGIINEAGEYDGAKIREIISSIAIRDDLKVVEACTKESYGDGKSNAFKLAKCYYDSSRRSYNP